jgi:transposase-like protein
MAKPGASNAQTRVRFPPPALSSPSESFAKLSLMKTAERIEARRIRRDEGASMKKIARRLGVSVSSISLWVRDIELSPEQRAALRNKVSGGWSANATAARRRRRESQAGGRALGARAGSGGRSTLRSRDHAVLGRRSEGACRTSAFESLATSSPTISPGSVRSSSSGSTPSSFHDPVTKIDRERLFEVQPAETEGPAPVRDLQTRRL